MPNYVENGGREFAFGLLFGGAAVITAGRAGYYIVCGIAIAIFALRLVFHRRRQHMGLES